MTGAHDPRQPYQQPTSTRSTSSDLREMTDEWTTEQAFVEQNRASVEEDEDWIKMYSGQKMEENY